MLEYKKLLYQGYVGFGNDAEAQKALREIKAMMFPAMFEVEVAKDKDKTAAMMEEVKYAYQISGDKDGVFSASKERMVDES